VLEEKVSRVAAIQMASGPQVAANLESASRLIDLAADSGAKLVVLPENFAIMGMTEQDKLKVSEEEGRGHIQDFLSNKARSHGIWLVGGTVPIKSDDPERVYAASLLYDDQGKLVARYNKIHLFDVHLMDSDEHYAESETTLSGEDVIVVDTPVGKLGMAVCYDLRFPELFRNMQSLGAEIFVLPSSFTAMTGHAHWESLIRARAIENLSYVVAPGQGGYHVNGRETYGHSMIVDPWGNVLNQLKSGTGIVVADLDMARLNKIRNSFPSLEHRRLSCAIGAA
jgi:nitrilase